MKQKGCSRNEKNITLFDIYNFFNISLCRSRHFPSKRTNRSRRNTASKHQFTKKTNQKIPIILTKLDESEYFASSNVNLEPGQHNLQIKLLYIENNILEEKIFEKPFTVSSSLPSIVLDPALITISPKELNPYFKVYLTSKEKDTINLNIQSPEEFIYPSRNTISLPSNEQRYFFLYTISSKEQKETAIKLTGPNQEYLIPVFLIEQS